jgi:hypothetical protein
VGVWASSLAVLFGLGLVAGAKTTAEQLKLVLEEHPKVPLFRFIQV